jgi:hypothetical protein
MNRRTRARAAALLIIPAIAALALTATACSTTPTRATLRAVAPATDDQRAALIDRIKSLAGDWELTGDGAAAFPTGTTAATFTVSSNGSVVREIMFPGAVHEMTNIYHMDGPDLVMTHYCAVGNQPRLRAGATTPDGPILFDTDSVTNLASADDHYMGQMTLEILTPDTIRQTWRSYVNGKLAEDHAVFDLQRRK